MSAFRNSGIGTRRAFRYVMEPVGVFTAATGKHFRELLWISPSLAKFDSGDT